MKRLFLSLTYSKNHHGERNDDHGVLSISSKSCAATFCPRSFFLYRGVYPRVHLGSACSAFSTATARGSPTILMFSPTGSFPLSALCHLFLRSSSAVLLLLFAYTGYRMVMNQVEYEQSFRE